MFLLTNCTVDIINMLQNSWDFLSCFSGYSKNFLGTKETSLLLMAMFLLAVFYHGQQVADTHTNANLTADQGPFSAYLIMSRF